MTKTATKSAPVPAANRPEIDKSVMDQRLQRGVEAEVVSDKKVDFTMDLARQMIEMPEFKGERPLRDGHVEFLTQHAKNGTFMPEQATLIDCLCRYDGVIRRLNGHHTAWMRHFMPPDWVPKIRCLRYAVEDEEDFRMLYSLIDRGAPRSQGHVAIARLFDTERYAGISKSAISMTKNGFAYWMWGDNTTARRQHRIDEIVRLMESENYQICHEVAIFINDLTVVEAYLKRACVIGAIFATFSKAKNDAVAFWTPVRTGLDITDPHDPRKTLRDYLQRMKVGGNIFNKNNIVHAETMYRGCIHAWNAFRRKEQLRHISSPASENRPTVK
jgi:hypothetical protein